MNYLPFTNVMLQSYNFIIAVSNLRTLDRYGTIQKKVLISITNLNTYQSGGYRPNQKLGVGYKTLRTTIVDVFYRLATFNLL